MGNGDCDGDDDARAAPSLARRGSPVPQPTSSTRSDDIARSGHCQAYQPVRDDLGWPTSGASAIDRLAEVVDHAPKRRFLSVRRLAPALILALAPLLGPPTGRWVSIAAFEPWRLRDGQCAEHWLQLDLVGLLQQVGAVLSAGASQCGSAVWEG
jgi:hypothetical protein